MGAEHEVLLYHTEVSWLSKGHVVKHLVELHAEVSLFLHEHNSNIAENFDYRDFVLSLAYLADVFGQMNRFSVSLQGSDITLIDATEKLQALTSLLPLWKRRVEKGNYANFPHLEEALLNISVDTDKTLLPPSLKKDICSHLETLATSFDGYFSLGSTQFEPWIRNPFLVDLDSIDDNDMAKDDIIELRTKQLLRSEFDTQDLTECWCSSVATAYPLLAKRAIPLLVPLATTYLCESGFSTLVAMKTKGRNRLAACGDMSVALSKTKPQFSVLADSKQ